MKRSTLFSIISLFLLTALLQLTMTGCSENPAGGSGDISQYDTLIIKDTVVISSGGDILLDLSGASPYVSLDFFYDYDFSNLKMLAINENNNIKDLTPIQALTNLEYLNISSVHSVDSIAIVDMPNLKVLHMTHMLDSVPIFLNNLPNLREVYAHGSQWLGIKDVSFLAGLTQITTLSVGSSDLPTAEYPTALSVLGVGDTLLITGDVVLSGNVVTGFSPYTTINFISSVIARGVTVIGWYMHYSTTSKTVYWNYNTNSVI